MIVSANQIGLDPCVSTTQVNAVPIVTDVQTQGLSIAFNVVKMQQGTSSPELASANKDGRVIFVANTPSVIQYVILEIERDCESVQVLLTALYALSTPTAIISVLANAMMAGLDLTVRSTMEYATLSVHSLAMVQAPTTVTAVLSMLSAMMILNEH